MVVSQIIFYIIAAVTLISAAIVVFARRIIYSAFALLATFLGVACIYIYLAADFLAATQVLVYVGGILVLLIFGVMLTQKINDVKFRVERVQFLPGLIVAIAVFVTLFMVITKTFWPLAEKKVLEPTTAKVGILLMTDFLLPFEIASVLLLVALIGAAMFARKEPPK